MTSITSRFSELIDLLPQFEKKSGSQIQLAASLIAEAFASGNKILIDKIGKSNIYALQTMGRYLKTKIVIHNTKSKIMYSA